MSLLKISSDYDEKDPAVVAALKFFDQFNLVEELSTPEERVYRVSSETYGLIYELNDIVTLSARIEPSQIMGSEAIICKAKVVQINDVGLNTEENPSCKPNPKISFEHRSQGSSKGVKSKG